MSRSTNWRSRRKQAQALIAQIEASPHLQERLHTEHSYRFTEINVSRHWPQVEQQIFHIMTAGACGTIGESWRSAPCWPPKVGFEKLRLKRYVPGGVEHFRRSRSDAGG